MSALRWCLLCLGCVATGYFANHVATVNADIRVMAEQIQSLRAEIVGQDVRVVTVTAYTASRDETNSDPGNTAIMQKPVPGWTIAVSRDLLSDGWAFGDKVWIEGAGLFQIADVMNSRWTRRIDVLVGTKKQARSFGVRQDVTAVRVRGGLGGM